MPCRLTLALFFAALLCHTTSKSIQAERPNIILVMADDMGWSDAG